MAKASPKKSKPVTPASSAPAQTWWASPWLFLGALLAVTVAIYWPVQDFDFTNYDDADYITHNWHVLTGLTWENIRWAFTTGYMGNWLPLAWLSHMLDVELFGRGAGGPHMVNVFIHAANSALVFLWLRQMTGAHWRSVAVAALFALHPLRVESVAWACERRDVLSVFFGLCALLTYTKYAKLKDCRRRWYLLALAAFAASLMSKPMLVTLPFALLLLDFWPLNRFEFSALKVQLPMIRRLLVEKIPFLILTIGFSLATMKLQKAVGAVSSLDVLAFDVRAGNALVSYARYLGKLFWPTDLILPYLLATPWATWQVAGAAILLLLISFVVLWRIRQQRFMAVGWFWFVGTLVPVIGLVQAGPQAMADRFVYLPAIGVLVMLIWGIGELVARGVIPRLMVVISMLGVTAVLSVRTAQQLKIWQNTETLFLHTLAIDPNNDSALNSLGVYYAGLGRGDEAIGLYRRALAVNPRHSQTLNNLGNAFAARGQHAEAIGCFQTAIGIAPQHPEAYVNLGAALAATGRVDDAIAQFRKALELQADNPDACNNLGNALVMKGNVEEGIATFRRVVQLRPMDADSHYNLGNALAIGGRMDEAIVAFKEALRWQPASLKARNNLGCAYLQGGRLAEAQVEFETVLKSAPDNPETNLRLGMTLAKLGRRDEAVARFMKVLQIQPGNEEVRRELQALGLPLGR